MKLIDTNKLILFDLGLLNTLDRGRESLCVYDQVIFSAAAAVCSLHVCAPPHVAIVLK